jgi:HEAT repeat protein
LIDLKQRDKTPKIFSALSQLGNMKVDPTRQAEVAAVLETVAVDSKLDTTMRESAIKLIPTWSGKESAELLIRLLEDKSSSVRISAIDALVESKSPLAAPALIKKWDKFDADRITRALIILGQDIEPIVLPYLNNTTNMNIRVEACRVLQQVGTTESLKPLLDLINAKDQSPTLATAAKEAMKQILDRNK